MNCSVYIFTFLLYLVAGRGVQKCDDEYYLQETAVPCLPFYSRTRSDLQCFLPSAAGSFVQIAEPPKYTYNRCV